MSSVIETVTEMVQPILDEKNFELVDMEFVKEGKSWYLRVFIDKEGGIDIEECAYVSELLSEKLDSCDPDPIPQAYFLEVSSPGAERPLKKESDYQAIDGEKQYEGVLEALTPETLTLKYRVKTRVKELTIERKNIAKARLAIQF